MFCEGISTVFCFFLFFCFLLFRLHSHPSRVYPMPGTSPFRCPARSCVCLPLSLFIVPSTRLMPFAWNGKQIQTEANQKKRNAGPGPGLGPFYAGTDRFGRRANRASRKNGRTDRAARRRKADGGDGQTNRQTSTLEFVFFGLLI